MYPRARRAVGAVETYALALAGWYLLLLTLGIPTLPPAGHVLAAVAFGGFVLGTGVAAYRLDADDRFRTFRRLTVCFVVCSVAASLAVGLTPLSVKEFMRGSVFGRALVAVVGACLFAGVVVGVATMLRSLARRLPSPA